MTFLETGPGRGDHRRQPADADQAGRACARSSDLLAVAREMREHGRNAIWVASDLLRGEKARTHDVAAASPSSTSSGMHARAAAKFVHLATRFEAHVRVARDGREMDGKSIMGILLLAAARGIDDHDHAPTAPTRRDARRRRSCALVAARLRRGRMQRLTGIGVSPGVVVGRAVVLIQRAQVLRYPDRAGARRARARAARREPRAGRASSCSDIQRAGRAAARAASSRRSSTRSC